MVQRLSEREVSTVEVQGEGSWVRICPLTVGEILGIQRRRELVASPWYKWGRLSGWLRTLFNPLRQSNETEQLMLSTISRVSSWNWVNSSGDPLPQPRTESNIVFQLTNDEYTAVFRAVYGLGTASEQQKN